MAGRQDALTWLADVGSRSPLVQKPVLIQTDVMATTKAIPGKQALSIKRLSDQQGADESTGHGSLQNDAQG